jgi:hypothetical protein
VERDLLFSLQEDQQADINLAPEYSPDYPVIFNIMLWFSIAFTFSLLAISCEYSITVTDQVIGGFICLRNITILG